ncbi:hypothetical protein HZA57_00765 [Candidatus Poribacteria bacterium]|nr:hypothetical protein [Candidatus Poribacteria bacterium]
MERWLAALDGAVFCWERKYPRWAVVIFCAILLHAASAFLVTPETRPLVFGPTSYAYLSIHPGDFGSQSKIPHRLLAPVVAHVLFLRGSWFLAVPIAASLAFVALVFAHFRVTGLAPSAALGLAAALAVSSPVALALRIYDSVDPVSFLLLWCALVNWRKAAVCGAFYALSLLNHEANLFALPWLALLPWREKAEARLRWRHMAALGCSLAPMLVLRHAIGQLGEIPFSACSYLQWENIKATLAPNPTMLLLGTFEAFRLFWFLPFCGAIFAWRRGHKRASLWLIAAIFSALAQLLVASDTSRLAGFAFVAVLSGSETLHECMGRKKFTQFLWWLFLANLAVPHYYVAQGGAIPLYPVPVSFVRVLLLGEPA